MRIRTPRKSTIVDKQYRCFVHRDFVKAMGLLGGGEIEWFVTENGQAGFQKANRKKKFRWG